MRRVVLAALAALALLFSAAAGTFAQLAIPSGRIFGGITINGQNAPAGTSVAAYAGQTFCGVTSGTGFYNGYQYFLDLNGNQPACAGPGTALTFTVNGAPANEVAYVPSIAGTAEQVNLTSGGGQGYQPVYGQPGYGQSPNYGQGSGYGQSPYYNQPTNYGQPSNYAPPPPTTAPPQAAYQPYYAPAAAPTNVQANVGSPYSMYFNWAPVTGGSNGYMVYSPYPTPTEQYVSSPYFSLSNLNPGSYYCLTVLALGAGGGGNSPWSDYACSTTASAGSPASAALPASSGCAGGFPFDLNGCASAQGSGNCPAASIYVLNIQVCLP